MNTSVYGIYKSREDLTSAVRMLKSEGFGNSNISVLLPNEESTKNFAHEKSSKAPEGSVAGAIVGALAGGILGGLIGAGELVFEGAGPFIAAGPVMGTLAGIGLLGLIGGILGALAGLAMPEYEAKRYEGESARGGMLLSVQCDDAYWKAIAKDILKETSATGVSSGKITGGGSMQGSRTA